MKNPYSKYIPLMGILVLLPFTLCKEKNPFTPPGGEGDILSSLDQEDIAKLGEAVKISGKLTYDAFEKGMIQIDVVPLKGKGSGPITIKRLEKPGDFEIFVPRDTGKVNIVAFVDVNENGPDGEDPKGSFEKNPLEVGVEDVSDIEIKIVDITPPPPSAPGEGTVPPPAVKGEEQAPSPPPEEAKMGPKGGPGKGPLPAPPGKGEKTGGGKVEEHPGP